MKPLNLLSDDEFSDLVQRSVALADAPPALVRAAIDGWPAQHATALQDVAGAAWRLVSAVLSFDSWARPPVALGMRGAAADTRHLLFSAGGRDIDLRISATADLFALTGQILGPDEAGVIELAAQPADGLAGSSAYVTSLDYLGEFRLNAVRGGTYRLTLRMGSDEIVLPPIVIGERPQ
jgi:hypothetical protein